MTTVEKEKIFMEMLDSYKNQIYRVCWGFTKNSQDVEDLFQEIILNVWKGLDGFRKESAPSTWIYRIAVNTCILWRKKSNKVESLDAVKIPETMIQNEAFQTEHNPKLLKLRAAIQNLKKFDRSLMLLVIEGFSYKEIAEISGITVTNVGAKINRIKSKIKKQLSS